MKSILGKCRSIFHSHFNQILFRANEVKTGLVLSFMRKIVHSNITVVYENDYFKASHDDDVGHYNSEDENIDVDALTYPDVLWRGEFQPRSEDGQEEEQKHISSNESANFNQISPFLVFTAGKIVLFGVGFFWLFPRAQWSPYYYYE